MAKQFARKEKSAKFAEGGDTHMFGEQDAGPEASGVTSHKTKGDGGKFASGGSTKMHGYAPSVPARSGITSAR